MSSEEQAWVRPDEMALVRRLKDNVSLVTKNNRWYVTDFLTPREQFLLTSIGRQAGVVLAFNGGYADAERKRALIMPEDWYPLQSDFQIARLKLEAVGNVTHGSVLGSLMGLGLERRVLGDIAFAVDSVYVFVTSTIAQFVQDSLVQVGRSPVHARLDDSSYEIKTLPRNVVEKTIFVSSLRVDAVIAQSSGLSRGTAQDYISKGLVTLNFVPVTKPDSVLFPGDILSMRHFGRVMIREIMGFTKKERLRVVVGILKSSS